MPQLTASSSIALQLEDVNDVIPLLVESSHSLDARIKDNGRSTRVSTKSFRIRILTALTGAVAKINLDGGALPSGGSSQWDQFTITPLSYAVPIQYTRLVDLVGEPKEVATVNPVSKTIADAAIYVQRMRDIFLQTAGDGKLAAVVANGVNAANASITLPVLRLAQNQIVQALGADGLKGQIWHTHPSQLQAYEELGFQLQYIPLADGKAKNFDGLFQKMTIDGREIINNLHADQSRWDLVNVKTWGKVKWGNPPFWFKNRGGNTVFHQYDTTTGNPQAIEKSYLVDAIQFYVDNPKSLGSVTSCKVPAGN